jgi:SAM-dependent methyltransferase
MDLDQLGRAGRFDELRRMLVSSGYTEEAICSRLGLRRLSDYEMDPARRAPMPSPADAADALIRLYLAGEPVARAAADCLLDAALLEGMGLLGQMDALNCHGTVALYPVDGLYIASDRWSCPDGSQFVAPSDTVYPALVRNTRLFLDLVPDGPCDSCLDLGSGTGIAAFSAVRHGARHAWAADIAERSTGFAEFNRRLNGLDSVTAVTSDLYDGLQGRTFDRIVAHPPYMPVLKPKWVYLSGGEDGEQVTRRIVEGLPRHLREGGLCCCLTMGSDRRDRPFEWRVRDWLGQSQAEFDIALIVRRFVEPREFAISATPYEPRTSAEAKAWRDLFARLEITSLAYGFLAIQRHGRNRGCFTVRRDTSPDFCRADWQALLAWETVAAGDEFVPTLMDARLRAAPSAEFEVLHRLTAQGWDPAAYRLRLERPFQVTCQAEPWAAHLISQCDGHLTGREHFERFRETGIVSSATTEAEFAAAVAPLVSGGFIEPHLPLLETSQPPTPPPAAE